MMKILKNSMTMMRVKKMAVRKLKAVYENYKRDIQFKIVYLKVWPKFTTTTLTTMMMMISKPMNMKVTQMEILI